MIRKIVLSLLLIIGASISSVAQLNSRPKFIISGDAGGQVAYKNHQSTVLGAALSYKHPVSANLALALSAGYTSFVTADKVYGGDVVLSVPFNAIPLKAGARFYFHKGLYGEAYTGVAIGINSDAKNGFLYTPGVGCEFIDGIGIGLRYESWVYKRQSPYWYSSLNQIAFRLSYAF